MPGDFVSAIAECLAPGRATDELRELLRVLLGTSSSPPSDRPDLEELHKIISNPTPSSDEIAAAQRIISASLGEVNDRIALVYGGATKIKGYVFEAPKLPEIRGASALLDWVNEIKLPKLWDASRSEEYDEKGIVYSSGGSILAFAPADKGRERAAMIERLYTEHTLAANSVAVSETCSLLELRYGRLNMGSGQELFWIDKFRAAWRRGGDARRTLAAYYYYPPDADAPDDDSDAALDRRFFNRKTFGELVTLLATMANRRRDERAAHGDTRSVPHYALIPWAEKCDSSDLRPAVWSGTVVDEERQLSEASARKRYVGQTIKKDSEQATKWYRDTFPNSTIPDSLVERSWERQWEEYLNEEGADTHYAAQMKRFGIKPEDAEPPKDVGWISQASNPRRYLGVIYADGNNVGRLVATLKTPAQYAAVSKSLSEVSQMAVFQALADFLEPVRIALNAREKRIRGTNDDTAWVHPFEILAIGGDDLFVIVPGDKALDIAASIAGYFEREIAQRLREILKLPAKARSVSGSEQRFAGSTKLREQDDTPLIGLSAGVIVAQENAPIFFLRDLVDELLKSAKGRAKEHAKRDFYGGAVDFMVMKSITMVTDNIKSFRRQALGDDGGDSARRLTARPYTWHEFAGLLKTVRAIKSARVPRSQLYRLRRALDAEPGSAITPSVMEYLYTRTRIARSYGEALLQHIEQPWCWETPRADRAAKLPPWMPLGTAGWETIWADLLEVYEMVPAEDQP